MSNEAAIAPESKEKIEQIVNQAVDSVIANLLKILPVRTPKVQKKDDSVVVRTSNCGRGYVLITRGQRPSVPNLEVFSIQKPSFKMIEGMVYKLSEDKTQVLQETLGQQPSWASIKEARTIDNIRKKIAAVTQTDLSKISSKKEQDEKTQMTFQGAEKALEELGFKS